MTRHRVFHSGILALAAWAIVLSPIAFFILPGVRVVILGSVLLRNHQCCLSVPFLETLINLLPATTALLLRYTQQLSPIALAPLILFSHSLRSPAAPPPYNGALLANSLPIRGDSE